MSGLDHWLRELRRAVAWRRRLLMAGLLAGSMAFALQALAPSAPAGERVVVATRDVGSGSILAGRDLRLETRPSSSIPMGALTSLASARGRPITAAVRRGEMLTDVRLAGPSALAGLDPTLVAVTVRVTDPVVATLVRVGDQVDVLGAGLAVSASRAASTGSRDSPAAVEELAPLGLGAQVGRARIVATDLRVLSIPAAGSGSLSRFGTGGGRGSEGSTVLVVATSLAAAADLAAASVGEQLSLVLRPR